MLYKPDLVDRARALSAAAILDAPREAADLAERVADYERNEKLGGPECFRLQQALKALRDALGGNDEADQLQREATEAYFF